MEREFLNRLLKITEGCRDSMHEPDEQNIKVRVIGDHLDNAMGEGLTYDSRVFGGRIITQEFLVIIERDSKQEVFNLASLIALARKAKL